MKMFPWLGQSRHSLFRSSVIFFSFRCLDLVELYLGLRLCKIVKQQFMAIIHMLTRWISNIPLLSGRCLLMEDSLFFLNENILHN